MTADIYGSAPRPHPKEGNGRHRQVKVLAPEWVPSTEGIVELDAGIVPVVTALWQLGAATFCSCQGDPGRWGRSAYVTMTEQRAARVMYAALRAGVDVEMASVKAGVKLYFDPDDLPALTKAVDADALRDSDTVEQHPQAGPRPVTTVHLPEN